MRTYSATANGGERAWISLTREGKRPAARALRWLQSLARLVALAAALLVGADEADARSANAADLGAGAALISARVSAVAADTAQTQHRLKLAQMGSSSSGSLSGLFNRGGLLGGFAAGFLGSGLLGLLFGRGLFDGLSGVPSYLGLLFQIALLAMLGRMIWSLWHDRDAPKAAAWSPRQLADPYLRSREDSHAGYDQSRDFEHVADDRPTANPGKINEKGDKGG